MYSGLITVLSEKLSEKIKKTAFIEIIFMSYSFVHRKINEEAFPDAPDLYDKDKMQVRGRGKYGYNQPSRQEGELFFRNCRIWKYYISAKCFRLIPTYPYVGKRSRESSGIRGFCQDTYFPIGWMFITAYHPAYKISASIFTMRAGYFSFSLLQYYLKITGKEGNTYASGKNTNSSEREIPGIPI